MIEIMLMVLLSVLLTVGMAAKKDDKPKRAKPKPTLPLGLLIPGFIGTLGLLKDAWANIKDKQYDKALKGALKKMTGYDFEKKTFDMWDATFTIGWLVGGALHKGVGGWMGVNRALGAAHVPLFRL